MIERLDRLYHGWSNTSSETAWRRMHLGRVVSLGGWALLAVVVILGLREPGLIAYDAHAYWLAGGNFLHGLPLYALTGPIDYGAFRYPPVFALAWAPFSLLPDTVFGVAWGLLALLALRYLVGSWKRVGWCLWFPPVIVEIIQANVILLTGAAVFATLRSRGAVLLPALAFLKIGPVICLPYLWIRRPTTRRALVLGVLAVLAACLLTALLSPAAWPDYFAYLSDQTRMATSLSSLMLFPSPLADFAIRLLLAGVLGLIAILRRSEALVFLAAIIAVPVFWPASLAALVALPRLASRPAREPARGISVVVAVGEPDGWAS